MTVPFRIPLTAMSVFFAVSNLTSCATGGGNRSPIPSPEIYPIQTPVAGNYPQGLYKYPYKAVSLNDEIFTQTLEWLPAVSKTYAVDTEYTAVLTLVPAGKKRTFAGTLLEDVKGLPENGVVDITAENAEENLVIKIVFEKTASQNAEPQIIFEDDFSGTSLDMTKWDYCPEWDRQGRSTWKDDMVEVGGGFLHIKLRRDAALGRTKTSNRAFSDNWIRTGGIRTRKKDWSILFDNTFGFYEARIKFPGVRGTWGAFWLMSPTQQLLGDGGADGTEIDIVESIHNEDNRYNAAMHWDGYDAHYKGIGTEGIPLPVENIYDGEFHTFALDWSPAEYVFYVDGVEFWRIKDDAVYDINIRGPGWPTPTVKGNPGINQNPNYIKLTVEGAEWAGELPEDFTEDEMLVDYVRVWNQPR